VDGIARDFVDNLKKKMLESVHGSFSMDFQSSVFNYTIEGMWLAEGSSLRETGIAEARKEQTTLRALTALVQ
jgi:hypothetical protein